MSDHHEPLEIIRARAGLLPPEDGERVLSHLEECESCFVELMQYVHEHYQEAKEYLAFGFLEDLESQLPGDVPESVKRRVAEAVPPMHLKVRELGEALQALELLSEDEACGLRELETLLGRQDRGEELSAQELDRASELLAAGLCGYQGLREDIRQRLEHKIQRLDSRMRGIFQRALRQGEAARVWPWRAVAASLPGKAEQAESLRSQKQYFLDLERAAILAKIVIERLQALMEAAGGMRVAPDTGPFEDVLAFCAGAISKCMDLERVPKVLSALKSSCAECGAECQFVTIRSRGLHLSEPLEVEPLPCEAQRPLGGWPGYDSLLPELFGLASCWEFDIHVVAELKRQVGLTDVELAVLLTEASAVDGALLISRVPLSRVKAAVTGDLSLKRRVHERGVLLLEWDEELETFTDFYPASGLGAYLEERTDLVVSHHRTIEKLWRDAPPDRGRFIREWMIVDAFEMAKMFRRRKPGKAAGCELGPISRRRLTKRTLNALPTGARLTSAMKAADGTSPLLEAQVPPVALRKTLWLVIRKYGLAGRVFEIVGP